MNQTTAYPLDAPLLAALDSALYIRGLVRIQRHRNKAARNLAAVALRNFRRECRTANIRAAVVLDALGYEDENHPLDDYCDQCEEAFPDNGERCGCLGSTDICGGMPAQLQPVESDGETSWVAPMIEVPGSKEYGPSFLLFEATACRVAMELRRYYTVDEITEKANPTGELREALGDAVSFGELFEDEGVAARVDWWRAVLEGKKTTPSDATLRAESEAIEQVEDYSAKHGLDLPGLWERCRRVVHPFANLDKQTFSAVVEHLREADASQYPAATKN